MLFNSYNFMIFFPIVVIIYFVIPKKVRYLWLLFASYFFYMSWNPKYAILIAISTVITYVSGILLDYLSPSHDFEIIKEKNIRVKKIVIVFSFAINLSILFFFKYFDFILENINSLLFKMGISIIEKPFDIILPVGISFYTFQALGYIVDVYRKDIKAEKNILRYALFVSFFPQLVAGPIERSKNLLHQLNNIDKINVWNYERITQGGILMLWGFFQKMVIADRASILVDQVYNSYWMYGSIELIVATILFAVQIYCDFASYSLIAIGAARIMGFQLMENFNTPYFSQSIKEFWQRWHISLSTWFRDYLYIPLGGNRCSTVKRYFNIMVTFLVSGLWHGASWSFIVWGGLHGFYQIIGDILKPWKEKFVIRFQIKTKSFSYKMGKMLLTFIFVDFAWIFFRMNSLRYSLEFIFRIFSQWNPWVLFDQSLYNLGLNTNEIHILFVALITMYLIDLIRYKENVTLDVFLEKQCLWFRWLTIFFMLFFIIIYGVYGSNFDAKQFIYFQF